LWKKLQIGAEQEKNLSSQNTSTSSFSFFVSTKSQTF
jgi:hypothetical protein